MHQKLPVPIACMVPDIPGVSLLHLSQLPTDIRTIFRPSRKPFMQPDTVWKVSGRAFCIHANCFNFHAILVKFIPSRHPTCPFFHIS